MRSDPRRGTAPILTGLGAALGALLCLALATASAQEEPEELSPVEGGGVVATVVGAGHLLTLPLEVERVALADETVARVQLISAREALITGLVPGQTTFYAWLADGRRLRYLLRVGRDLDLLLNVLAGLDPQIVVETSPDGAFVVLAGEVADERIAQRAVTLAESLLGPPGAAGGAVRVVDLLRYPVALSTADLWLTEALAAVDPRIRLRRLQVGPEPAPERDSYVLEGRVRNVQALVRAVILAERQLGGTGVQVGAPGGGLSSQRNQGFSGLGTGQAQLGSQSRPPGGLASQIARGLVVTSESGRVLALLAVDELPQIMVSIRVYEIDRAKARSLGVNFRFDSDHLSLGSVTGPQGALPRLLGSEPTVTGLGGNLAAAFVDQTLAIAAAIDLLQDKELARSVSEPNVLTLSGEEATVLVGGEVPIPTTAVGQVTTVQGFFFQSFGVQLDIRPTVDEDGVVALEVSPSIIRPAPGLAVGGVPGFQVQSVQTTARVPAGQSLVLGGLLTFEEGFEESRVPWLGRLPLFRWRRNSRLEQELLFVITPRLVAMPAAPTAPVTPAGTGDVLLPPLDWPADRSRWRDEFAPQALDPDGLPPGFRRRPPPAPVPWIETTTFAPEREDWQVGESVDPCLVLRLHPFLWSAQLDCLAPVTALRLVERAGDWRRVRLADGRTGWVPGGDLTPAPPDR